MKKIASIILMIATISTIFAYEPKVECAKVKRNGNIKYYEKTELHNNGPLGDRDYVRWVIRKDYTIEDIIDYQYMLLEDFRDDYNYFMEGVYNPKPSELIHYIADFEKRHLGIEISPEERQKQTSLRLANDNKNTAIIRILFVTEENFLTITKEEMLNKLNDFVNNLTK